MKTVLCFMPGSVGGSQRMMIAFAKFLDPKDYKVKVVIVQAKVGKIVDFVPSNFDIIHIKIRNILDFPVTRMIHLIRKEKADFLFSSIFYLNFRVLVAGKLTRTPVILRNDSYASKILGRLDKIFVRCIYHWAKKVILQQEDMRDEFKRMFNFPDEKMIVIHNPLDLDTIRKSIKVASPFPKDGSLNYVSVGRFNPIKGQDVLVNAFATMHNRLPNAHLYLIGRYEDQMAYFNDVKKIVEEKTLTSFVHFVGHDSNPYRWMANCDCYVIASRFEGLPNAMIEAMFLGKPAVSTKCTWIVNEIIEEGKNGYVVENEDYLTMGDAMVKAIQLKEIKMNYKPGTAEEFCPLFI